MCTPACPKAWRNCVPLGLPLACLTNKPTAFAEQLLERKGLRAHFQHVFGGDAFARKKPDPLPLLKTCEALGTSPAHTVMVGDSSNDAQAANAGRLPHHPRHLWLQPRPPHH
jgi:phosphoglycolate phosphatase